MPCFLVIIALLLPRVTMFFIWLLTDWFSRAYESILWPLLGFFFMPYTTLAYMAAMLNNNHQVSGGWLVVIGIAVFAGSEPPRRDGTAREQINDLVKHAVRGAVPCQPCRRRSRVLHAQQREENVKGNIPQPVTRLPRPGMDLYSLPLPLPLPEPCPAVCR